MHPSSSSVEASMPEPAAPPATGSQDIEDFIYLISHDVRSSVRALLELPQWIAEDLEEAGVKIDGSVAASIEMMNRHTGRLDRMLVDLLTFSRVGRMQDVTEHDFSTAMDEVLEEIALPSGFVVECDFACPTVVMGERDILTLLDALMQNAIKHHDQPTGRIQISSAIQNAEVVLRVIDDGPGIPEEFRDRVFGAMTTLRPRDEVEGTGIGLANVRKIAAHYGGTATIADAPEGKRGTLVEVRMKHTVVAH